MIENVTLWTSFPTTYQSSAVQTNIATLSSGSTSLWKAGSPALFQATQSSTSESEIDLFKQAELTLPPSGAKPVRTYAALTPGDGLLAAINVRTASPRACENRSQDEARANERRELRKLKTGKHKVVLSNGG
jgi:hypothetical protein